MDKKTLGFGLLGLLVVATIGFVVFGLSDGPAKPVTATGADQAQAEAALQDDEGAPGQAPVVRKEEGLRIEAAATPAPDLALPGQLPTLNVPKEQGVVVPTKPHGQFELEGEVQEADAEAAVRSVFPAIRDCYVELRQRAPQARGRMLMKFAIRPGTEAGQAALGELFLKETQFTDPKYLTCVRTAIDNTKFTVRGNVNGAVTVPLFLSPEDAGQTP